MASGVSVRGEYFESINEMLEYFKEHPIEKIRLQTEVSLRFDDFDDSLCSLCYVRGGDP